MEITNLTDNEVISMYSKIIEELKNRRIIRTKNILGDLGEYLAILHYNSIPGISNLQAAPPGTQNIDAISRKGDRYSIKSTSRRLTGVFYGLNDIDSDEEEIQKFEFVIIVIFKENFELNKIIELSWTEFLKYKKWHKTMRAWNISITKDLLEECKVIFDSTKI